MLTLSLGAAGNLVICQVLLMHISEEVLDENQRIDPYKLDAVARLGRDWYCRVQGNAIFKVPRPNDKVSMGIDQLPESIRNSKVLTGNDLGMLATVERLPEDTNDLHDNRVETARMKGTDAVHKLAQEYLQEGKIAEAWGVLIQDLRFKI